MPKWQKKIRQQLKENPSLPEHFEFKLLRQLEMDLGYRRTGDVASNLTERTETDEIVQFLGALRNNDAKKMSSFTRYLQPQSMLERDTGIEEFIAGYQLSSLLKKYPGKGPNSRDAAIIKFFETEHTCELYNGENYRSLLILNEKHPDFLGVVEEIRADIAGLIGEVPNVSILERMGRHGPGTSYIAELYERGEVTNFFKWQTTPYSVTAECVPYAKQAISADPRWIGALDDWYRQRCGNLYGPIDIQDFWSKVLVVVEGSRTTTVPKSFDIDRTICIEPLMNVFLQLGVDNIIRQRLKKRWDYDIDDQTLNQRLAEEGSLTGLLATLDLSSASDLISLIICMILLPEAWYDLLLDLRCKVTHIAGEEHRLSKMSSMGNGFTFALETLIFGALARCAMRRTECSHESSAVYGDDLIVPVKAYSYLVELLQLCGFKVNTEKSFAAGPFRESCGMDFYKGYNVRPFFLTKKVKTWSDLFYIHNSLWRLEERLPWFAGFDFSRSREWIRKYIPDYIQEMLYGPPSDSLDTYLFSNRLLPRKKGGYRIGLRLCITARTLKPKYGDYYFVKLMNNLSGRKTPNEHQFSKRTHASSGNSFSITKKNWVAIKVTECKVWN